MFFPLFSHLFWIKFSYIPGWFQINYTAVNSLNSWHVHFITIFLFKWFGKIDKPKQNIYTIQVINFIKVTINLYLSMENFYYKLLQDCISRYSNADFKNLAFTLEFSNIYVSVHVNLMYIPRVLLDHQSDCQVHPMSLRYS